MKTSIRTSLLGVAVWLFPAIAFAQTSRLIFVNRSYNLFQTGASTVQERQVINNIELTPVELAISGVGPFGAITYPANVSFELRGGNVVIPLERGSRTFSSTKTYANSAELNAALPPGNYAAVSVGGTTPLSYPITIPASSPPPLLVLNFDALQAWNGEDLVLRWVPLNSVENVAVTLSRANGDRAYTATTPSADGLPPSAFLRPGINETTVKGVTAAPGEILTGRIAYTAGGATLEFTVQRAPLPPVAPVIATQPQTRTALSGDDVSLSVTATGTGLTYQWRKDGNPVAGATDATLAIRQAQPSDSGSYTVVVTNTAGSVTSQAAVLTVTPRVTAPAIATAPAAKSISAGANVSFSVTATGTAPLTYQWLRNGVAIAGATQATFTLERARPSDRGQYSVTVTNATGTITSAAAELTVKPVSRIANLSILTSLASASDNFTLGFVLGGLTDPNAPKPVLVRAVGPSLAPLGVQGAVDDPKLELYAGQSLTTANDNWGGDATLAGSFTSVGAFGFANAASRDAAVLARVATSNNSIKISGAGGGLVLAELYDATVADEFGLASPRFANVSVLKQIGTGLTAGFVIDGSEPLRVLIRAVGPTLGGFGVSGTLADPKLDLFQSGNAAAIASNDNWGAAANAAQIASAAAGVGAFALAPESKDAVLLATLPPGNYTVQVSGVGGTTGTALVEVYEVP